MLHRGGKTEVSTIFEKHGLIPQVRFTTWDDYAIMSMVENGLGISILPELILQRCPYKIVIKPLDIPAYRNIGFVIKSRGSISITIKRFMEYLPYRY